MCRLAKRRDPIIDLVEAKNQEIDIGNDCFIVARCIIGKGIHIGEKSVIVAGSVVVKDVPAGVMGGAFTVKRTL